MECSLATIHFQGSLFFHNSCCPNPPGIFHAFGPYQPFPMSTWWASYPSECGSNTTSIVLLIAAELPLSICVNRHSTCIISDLQNNWKIFLFISQRKKLKLRKFVMHPRSFSLSVWGRPGDRLDSKLMFFPRCTVILLRLALCSHSA